jgi:DDE superfamily endonuclease
MPRLPARFTAVILCFAPLFFQRSWRYAEVLLIGAILAPGQRTVTGILRITGLCRERRFTNYHRVLNRASWSGRAAGRVMLGLLLDAFAPRGPVVLGLDDTIERRRGKRITAKGIYRDPVRSSKGHFVKASGLRWLSLMLLVPVPWAGRVWALPFLTALAPSERYSREHGKRHKRLTDWARQLVLQARRWLPDRALILVADSGFAALELLAALVRRGVTCVTRLRLDAALYEPAPPRRPGAIGRPRTKGARLPSLAAVLADEATPWRRVAVPDRGDPLRHRRLASPGDAGVADPLGAAA